MQDQNLFSKNGANSSMQAYVEEIWQQTCGTWDNVNESTVQDFLSQCDEKNIDSQFAMSWVEQNKENIPDWQSVSRVSLDWMNQHTSTGSPLMD
jgi:hypothetical protein